MARQRKRRARPLTNLLIRGNTLVPKKSTSIHRNPFEDAETDALAFDDYIKYHAEVARRREKRARPLINPLRRSNTLVPKKPTSIHRNPFEDAETDALAFDDYIKYHAELARRRGQWASRYRSQRGSEGERLVVRTVNWIEEKDG